ncbi:hypothetical protein B0H14DRAFT_3516820 [Mycena olivaceomarginata]|nr:hypothetical protein B0H14DRAFT_3516820 [Mycena olivaceomarginata]
MSMDEQQRREKRGTEIQVQGTDAGYQLRTTTHNGALTVPLPAVAALTAALPTVTSPSHGPGLQLACARDVIFLVDRTPTTSPSGVAQTPMPEAVYLRATFASARTYPNILPANQRSATSRRAARAGHTPALFRLARDYGAFSDTAHTIDCLNRGAMVFLHLSAMPVLTRNMRKNADLPALPAHPTPW